MTLLIDIATDIADNTTGDITPEKLRNILTDMVHELDMYQALTGKGAAGGYPGLDSNVKVPAQYLPVSNATPHHIFATQADMLAASADISAGDMILVHGDPQADKNGEYVALQDNPTTLVHYDHLGEHVAVHRHDGDDVDVTVNGHTDTLTAGLTAMSTHLATALQQDGSVDAEGVPFVSLNSTQVSALKANSIYLDNRQHLMLKDNNDVSVEMVGDAGALQVDGSVNALSLPLASVALPQQAAIGNNSFWLNEAQVLYWRDNAGADHTVTLGHAHP